MKKGKLLIISGFSGVGKGTVVKHILNKYGNYAISISATTRTPRNGEENGVHYHFMNHEQFEQLIEDDRLLEYARYVDNYYGTPSDFVTDKLESGNNVILEIETQGAIKVKQKMPEAIMIFVLPPSAKELKDRLVGRNTETEEVINKRLATAAKETEAMDYYEFFVINDEVDNCADNIDRIINNNKPDLPDEKKVLEIKEDIKGFSKGDM